MFQNNLTPTLKSFTNELLCSNQNEAMNYHDSNNERNHFDSHFSFLKPLLKDFKFIYILKIIPLMKV